MQNGKAGKGLSLWQKATVFLSLMSWFTTEQGFQNTVFVGENPAWSMFASFAIQTILLAGVLYGAYILEKFGGVKKIFCITIWSIVAIVSITFSYISISNSMYYVDFAVNGNQITEKFMRETVQSLEQNNLKKLEEIRPELVENLNRKGYDVMNTDIQTRARNYVTVSADFQKPAKEKYLAEVEERYLTPGERKKFAKNPRMRVTGEYARKAYPDTYKNRTTSPEYWKNIVAETINSLNHAGYQQYKYLYKQEVEIIESYNDFRKKIADEEEQFPTLDQMNALVDACVKLISNIEVTRSKVKGYEVKNKPTADGKGTYSINTANKYVDKACTVFDELSASVNNLKKTVEELIQHSYGLGNKSVDEILALVGNSNADVDELDKAREQMLGAQGSILKSGGEDLSNELVDKVNGLMSMLNNYVERMRYQQDIAVFKKECLGYTYNIVKDDKDIRDSQADGISDISSSTEQAIIGQATTGGAAEGVEEAVKVIDVTPGLWTSNRKVHMSKLSALIFEYPITSDDTVNYKKSLDDFGVQVHSKEKTFLDTSESEKAAGLLFGDRDDFPNKGKARLALVFAIFLDLGAALVGVLIYLVKEKGV